MRNFLRFAALGVVVVACNQDGAHAPAGGPQGVPPPSAFAHPGFVYYSNGVPPAAPPPATRMPPALSRVEPMNLAHLKAAVLQPRRCNIPQEVAPGVFAHVDCFPYRRVAVAVRHATPFKLDMLKAGRFHWNPFARPTAGTFRGTSPGGGAFGVTGTGPMGVNTAAQPLPDLVDHRLNGTEGPTKDQGDVGACTAFALSTVMDNALRRANQNITTSPEHVWAHYATPTMEDAAAGNLNRGVTTFEMLPYSGREACELTRDGTDDCGATYGVRPNTAASDAQLQARLRAADASNGHRVLAFEELAISPPNIDEVVATLASGADIWAGFNVDSSVWVNRRMQNFVIPDWSQPDGGHAVAIAGYRRVNGALQFLIHNSWGPTWGDGGYAWISQAMVQRWMHLAYKVRTDVDPGPGSATPPKTDEDCPGDQVLDSVTSACAGICPDRSRPANGQCPNGPAPPPQPLPLPAIPGMPGIPGMPQIPGMPAIPGWLLPGQPAPAPTTPGGPTPAPAPAPSTAPTAPSAPSAPWQIPTSWPWPVPSGLPPFFAPPQK
jgi:hypothetical protein